MRVNLHYQELCHTSIRLIHNKSPMIYFSPIICHVNLSISTNVSDRWTVKIDEQNILQNIQPWAPTKCYKLVCTIVNFVFGLAAVFTNITSAVIPFQFVLLITNSTLILVSIKQLQIMHSAMQIKRNDGHWTHNVRLCTTEH